MIWERKSVGGRTGLKKKKKKEPNLHFVKKAFVWKIGQYNLN